MKRKIQLILASATAILQAFLFSAGSVGADNIRKPAWAGSFYPSSGSELKKTIQQLTEKAKKSRIEIPDDRPLKAIIMPHAGYIYSGVVAGATGEAAAVSLPGAMAADPTYRTVQIAITARLR